MTSSGEFDREIASRNVKKLQRGSLCRGSILAAQTNASDAVSLLPPETIDSYTSQYSSKSSKARVDMKRTTLPKMRAVYDQRT